MKTIHELNNDREKTRIRASIWYQENKNTSTFKIKRHERTLKWREKNPSKYLLQHARARAKDRNVPFDLIEEDIQIPDVCPVFETPFEYGTPLSMSVDRKDPRKGYTRDNIQVISWKANMMKQDASTAQLKKFAEWVNRSIL